MDVSEFFFLLEEGEGGVRGARTGGGGFLLKSPGGGGVLQEGKGPRGREGVCGDLGNGEGLFFFFRGRNVHQDWVHVSLRGFSLAQTPSVHYLAGWGS